VGRILWRHGDHHSFQQLDSIVQRATTRAFKLPLRSGAIFAILVLPLLSVRLIYGRRTTQRLRTRLL